jgi:hypothetical protein
MLEFIESILPPEQLAVVDIGGRTKNPDALGIG